LLPSSPASAQVKKDVAASQNTLKPGDNPDFDNVAYGILQCDRTTEPQSEDSPASTDLVGTAVFPAIHVAFDSDYLYFRYRVNEDPSGPRGFAQNSWVALMQTPDGNAFQHQYQLGLNGIGAPDSFGNSGSQVGDTIEIWKNDLAEEVVFDPLFNDPSETRQFAQRYDYSGPGTTNTTPLARITLATDGSTFGSTPDYFVEFAFPVSVLIAHGVIGSAADLAQSIFFPATSTDASQYNQDHLACRFLPSARLSITKATQPKVLPTNTSTDLSYPIVVTNHGPTTAKGVLIRGMAFPEYMTGVTVSISSDDATVTGSVRSENPLVVVVPMLPDGSDVTVQVDVTATPILRTPKASLTWLIRATTASLSRGEKAVRSSASSTAISKAAMGTSSWTRMARTGRASVRPHSGSVSICPRVKQMTPSSRPRRMIRRRVLTSARFPTTRAI
jgi:hypothetical protein